jgi:hypothetical protein
MRFIWFNLMPWPYLPDDFREKYRSVWVDAHTRAKGAVLDLQRPDIAGHPDRLPCHPPLDGGRGLRLGPRSGCPRPRSRIAPGRRGLAL